MRETRSRNKGLIEKNLLSLSYGRIVRRDIGSADGLVPASYETYQIVEPGQVVLRMTDLQKQLTAEIIELLQEVERWTAPWERQTSRRMENRSAFHGSERNAIPEQGAD
ncbi:hypothetical protein D9C01_12265 [Corynebacterium diphtheriae]|nr:hypothetical protein D9C01_12265 [Corynebacterium diphtheriae]